VIEVAASADLGYYRGTYHVIVETADGPVEDVGKFLAIWKKIHGEWKVIAECVNSDLPAVQQ
jgi:ketosteroid isomerase-like protein